jgi:protein-disulfide isomerase-like protein with CxxC motif
MDLGQSAERSMVVHQHGLRDSKREAARESTRRYLSSAWTAVLSSAIGSGFMSKRLVAHGLDSGVDLSLRAGNIAAASAAIVSEESAGKGTLRLFRSRRRARLQEARRKPLSASRREQGGSRAPRVDRNGA